MPIPSLYPQQTAFKPQPLGYQTPQMPNMSLNMPLNMFQQQRPRNELVGLHGYDSAKQYPMNPNETGVTFSLDSDHAFIHSSDANGVVSIKIIRYEVISEEEYRKEVEADAPVTIPKKEYDDLMNRVKKLEEEAENAK